MRKIRKIFMVFIASIILTANIGTVSYAANNENIISPMYVPCPNCSFGKLITTSESHTYHDRYEVCSVRNDCIITVTRTETNYVTRCSDCGYATSYHSGCMKHSVNRYLIRLKLKSVILTNIL